VHPGKVRRSGFCGADAVAQPKRFLSRSTFRHHPSKKKFHGNALAYININARKRDISNKLNLYILKNGIHVIKLKEYLKHASK